MICSLCGKEFDLHNDIVKFHETYPDVKYDMQICHDCFVKYTKINLQTGLDADYILVTGDNPVNRPNDWKMHDSELYTHQKEYFEYYTLGTVTLSE